MNNFAEIARSPFLSDRLLFAFVFVSATNMSAALDPADHTLEKIFAFVDENSERYIAGLAEAVSIPR